MSIKTKTGAVAEKLDLIRSLALAAGAQDTLKLVDGLSLMLEKARITDWSGIVADEINRIGTHAAEEVKDEKAGRRISWAFRALGELVRGSIGGSLL